MTEIKHQEISLIGKKRGLIAFAFAVSLSLTVSGLSSIQGATAAPKAGASVVKTTKDKKDAATADKDKDSKDKDVKDKDKDGKDKEKAEAPTPPEPPLENVQMVTTQELVDAPQKYLHKNVKFSAPFHSYTSLALDYKPALRASKTHLSFLILRPASTVPFSEIKLAMPIPKDKDPKNKLLQDLKDGDTIEVAGTVFATPMDEPWIDVKQLIKTASAPDPKKDKEKDSAKKEESK